MRHRETHSVSRVGWLRAAVLGANDGIVSTASLVLGVAAADPSRQAVLTAGIAGLVAGAMSMAAGEYVSVGSQKDTEDADLRREGAELDDDPEHEHAELSQIYVDRGVDPEAARRVAQQMMAHDALAAHARDELGISAMSTARPVEAALTAGTFAMGAVMPLAIAAVVPLAGLIPAVASVSLAALVLLGALAARVGGAGPLRGATRVGVGRLRCLFATANICVSDN